MRKHPDFDLVLHTDDELARLIGRPIRERRLLHEWPLSCVQRITLEDGDRFIYKSQAPPSVEHRFYRAVSSANVPSASVLLDEPGHVCLLIDFLDEPRVADLDLEPADAVRLGKDAAAVAESLDPDLPAFLRVEGAASWSSVVGETLTTARGLIDSGAFQRVDHSLLAGLESWASSAEVVGAAEGDPVYCHADLTAENLFLGPRGVRIVDWQFPRVAPRGVDLTLFLESVGVDPAGHVPEPVVAVTWFLRIHWMTECGARWIPAAAAVYDAAIPLLAARIGVQGRPAAS